jgi:hypothetical protein
MTQLSEREERNKALRELLAKEKAEEEATGVPRDTSWTDDLPSDPLPEEEGETSVVFVKKSE